MPRNWVLAMALAVVSCTAPPAEPAPVLLNSADLRLPLDEYLLSPLDLQTLERARVVMVRTCMGEAGFDFPPMGERVYAGLRSWNERRYGITDGELAAVDGFGLGARDPATRPTSTHAKPTPEQRLALEGENGCIERVDAAQRRTSQPGVDRELPQRLATDSYTRSRDAPGVRAVVKSWSECMRTNGYDYADPLAAGADDKFDGPVTAAERAAATVDVECKRKTNLVGVWFAEESAVQRELVAANQAALTEVRKANATQLAQARRIVGA